jgi:hypothetical protein
MVKKSNLKMGIVPKLTHKKTPDISHLTGVQCSKGCCNYPPIEAHGSPTLNELFPDVPKTTRTEINTEINKEVFEISRAIAQLTVYKVNRQVRARIAKLTEELIEQAKRVD